MYRVYLYLIAYLPLFLYAQSQPAIYPPHWWAGMKNSRLQLMIHGQDVGKGNPAVTAKYPGVKVTRVHYPENANYLFIDLILSEKVAAGTFPLVIHSDPPLTRR